MLKILIAPHTIRSLGFTACSMSLKSSITFLIESRLDKLRLLKGKKNQTEEWTKDRCFKAILNKSSKKWRTGEPVETSRESTTESNSHLKFSISVAIVSSSLLEELLGIPYPAWACLNVVCVTGGVKIAGASNECLGNSTPERCHSCSAWLLNNISSASQMQKNFQFFNYHALSDKTEITAERGGASIKDISEIALKRF